MQINRLFEIVYILFDKKTVTAKELAEHFEVSQRTIYRDIDTLSMGGIPIYTNKGKGGGISILPEYILNKSMLSDTEQNEILNALQSLKALKVPDVDSILNKIATIFNKNNNSWIDVDFSRWGSEEGEKEKFRILKDAIIEKKLMEFDYYSSYSEKSKRYVEPLKLVFKGQGWYVYAYCRDKSDFRMFKVTRIKNPIVHKETFSREIPQDILKNSDSAYKKDLTSVILKIDASMAFRLFDEFSESDIEELVDGSFLVKVTIPMGDWIYGYIMSYGEFIEVLEPQAIRETIAKKYAEGLKKYL